MNPVGSQAPNSVNSHKILNTFDPSEPQRAPESCPPALSYYAASSAIRRGGEPRAARAASCVTDVAVVGGGHRRLLGGAAPGAARVQGRACSRRTPSATERRDAAAGRRFSASRSAQKALAAQVGREDARRLFDLSIEALDLTQSLIRDHAHRLRLPAEPRSRRDQAAASRANSREWAEELHEEYGYASARLLESRRARRRTCAASAIWAGSSTRAAGTCTRSSTPRGWRAAAEAAGARDLREYRGAALRGGPRGARAYRARDACAAAHLVLCGNAYIGAVAPALARRILGVGHLHHRHRAARAKRAPARSCRATPRSPTSTGSWIISGCRADHRLLFGGRVSYSAVQPPRLAESMRRRMVRVFPHAGRSQGRVRLGRVPRHHHEPRARFRAARAECLLSARLFRPRHVAHRTRRSSSWPRRSPARRSDSMCSRACRIATFPAAACCAGRRWCWRCCTTGLRGPAVKRRQHARRLSVRESAISAPGFFLLEARPNQLLWPVSSRVTEFRPPPCEPSRSGLNSTLTRSPGLREWRVQPARVSTPGLVVSKRPLLRRRRRPPAAPAPRSRSADWSTGSVFTVPLRVKVLVRSYIAKE